MHPDNELPKTQDETAGIAAAAHETGGAAAPHVPLAHLQEEEKSEHNENGQQVNQ